jgi:2-octaprenyl-6-methoxyphenol hydroxylase
MRICILGDGLSSLTLAKSLVNQKVYVDILTQKKHQASSYSRTIGISKNSTDYFNNNIINIKKLIWSLKKIEIFTDNLKNEKLLNFQNNHQDLFSILKNNELYELLEKDLSRNKYFKRKLIKKKDLSFINEYQLIINCDYAHPLTNKYFSKKIIKKYNSFAYTTIIKHKKVLNNVASQIFTKKGPLAFLPISNKETSVVYSIYESNNLKEKNIKELIQSYNFKYEIIKIENIDIFELKSLSLRNYYHSNILAFGDLLHRVHPLAGQGFNMTIRDIAIFTKLVRDRCELGLPLDSSLNKEFEHNVKYKNFIFSSGVDLIHKFFNIESKTRSSAISKSVQFILSNPSINKIFTKIADKGILF